MNELEKKSFYSFLSLYIVSSFFFMGFISFWYYQAQKHTLESETYYKLEHLADKEAGKIIMAHMSKKMLKEVNASKDIKLALIDTRGKVVEGSLVKPDMAVKPGYYSVDGWNILVSDAPHKHLNVAYVVTQSNSLKKQLETMRNTILEVMLLVSLLIVSIAWMLSRLFMKPVRERIQHIERFINDVTHELNTPITSLQMLSDQAIKQGKCTDKTLKNISIGTKQLYDIYRSLTYLNFKNKREGIAEALDFKEVLEKSIEYYTPLAEIKRIEFDASLEPTQCVIPEAQLSLLLGNLIGNAIKYSLPKSKVTIRLRDRVFMIKDEGIGIDPKKQKAIFERFERGTEYSGGFGVGLSIVKSICDEYGIAIELHSVLGKGTEFKLKL